MLFGKPRLDIVLILSCFSVFAHAQPTQRDPAVARLAAAERRFSQRIYQAVAEGRRDVNLVLAPYGVMESLAMLQVGARGDTREMIAGVTGLRAIDAGTVAAFARVRGSAFPIAYRFGAAVSDNDRYGVKIIDEPIPGVAGVGLAKGDLIFLVDGRPVRTAREFTAACDASTGSVRLDGFSVASGRPFSNLVAPLSFARDLDVAPNARVMNFASALWLRDDFTVDSTYPARLRRLFDTSTFPTSFRDRDEISQQANEFFAKQTGGRISRVHMPESLNPNTVMLLMNAMAMDAKWERRFSSGLTKPGPFESPTGDLEVQYMSQQSVFAFANINGLRVIELPYKKTNLRMTIFLPETPDGWSETERSVMLNDLELHNIARRMQPTRVSLKLPRFDIRMSGSLKESVSALGLGVLFTEEADFRGIDERNRVMLDDMRQQVYVTTNEDGTRAGAVTQAVGILKSAVVQSEQFHATHPFLFLIRDSHGVVYFAGRVVKPAG